jgi:glycosyltransferase involved in cell wall biosynthesis
VDGILTAYPLSREFRDEVMGFAGRDSVVMSLVELRQLPLLDMVRRLRMLRVDRLLLPVEDVNGGALLPVLKLLSGLVPTRRIEVVRPDLSRVLVRKSEIPGAVTQLLLASLGGRWALRRVGGEVSDLLTTDLSTPPPKVRPRILYLNANLWFGVKAGGSIGHISGVVNGLVSHGFDVDFYSAGGRMMVDPATAYTALLPPAHFGLPWELNYYRFHYSVLNQLSRSEEAGRYGAIYQRMSVANFSGVALSRRFGIPLILEYNGSEAWVAKNWGRAFRYQDIAERTELACLKHAHLVVTISDVLREDLESRGVEPARIVTYPNCVDPSLFDPDRFDEGDLEELRMRYGIGRDATVVTFVGTFGQWHGAEVLAQAIANLIRGEAGFLREHRVRFLFVGDGVKMPEVRQVLGDEADGEFVVLTGLIPQPEAPLHLAASDILCSPHVPNEDGTRFFGSPTKLFEYMAMGRAIIASDLDQVGEVLTPGVRATDRSAPEGSNSALALLVSPGSVVDLMRGLTVLVGDAELRAALGENARRKALAEYTWERHVEEIVEKARAIRVFG